MWTASYTCQKVRKKRLCATVLAEKYGWIFVLDGTSCPSCCRRSLPADKGRTYLLSRRWVKSSTRRHVKGTPAWKILSFSKEHPLLRAQTLSSWGEEEADPWEHGVSPEQLWDQLPQPQAHFRARQWAAGSSTLNLCAHLLSVAQGSLLQQWLCSQPTCSCSYLCSWSTAGLYHT